MKHSLNYYGVVSAVLLVIAAAVGIPFAAFTYGFTWVDWVTFVGMYLASGFGITIGYHRLLTHRSFEAPAPVKAVLLVFGAWALENSALTWCADHVRHHACTDTEEDPYNAKRGFWFSHLGWLFIEDPHRISRYETPFRRDPLVVWQHRYYLPLFFTGLAIPFVIGFLHRGLPGAIACFALAGVARVLVILNASFATNSICHLWGTQPHGGRNTSRNVVWLSLLTLGEGYHNYHHAHARDYRNGHKWHHLDPSKWVIFLLAKVGVAKNLHRASAHSES